MGAAKNWVWFFRTVPPLTHMMAPFFFPTESMKGCCYISACTAAVLQHFVGSFHITASGDDCVQLGSPESVALFFFFFFFIVTLILSLFFFFLLLHMTRLRHTEKGSSSKQFRGNVNVADSGPFDWHGHFPFDCQSNPFPCGHNQIAAPCPFFVAYLCAWHVWSRRVTWPSAG